MLEFIRHYASYFYTAEIAVIVTLYMVVLLIKHYTRQTKVDKTRLTNPQVDTAKQKLHEFVAEIEDARKSFIDHRMMIDIKERYENAYKVFLNNGTAMSEPDIQLAAETFRSLSDKVETWNSDFVRAESARCDELFGRLDERQREACVSDEINTIVVAGAGSGKTSTIQKKVEYLVREKHIAPENILLLSFTNKAADEMTSRLDSALPDQRMIASTFHKFGLEILKPVLPCSCDIADPQLCGKTVLGALSPDAMTEDECRGFLRFFAYTFNAEPTDLEKYKTYGDYINDTRMTDFQTLRGMMNNGKGEKTTFGGEIVKSFEELEIANWLFLNGIKYEYEKKYTGKLPPNIDSWHRAYKPDFYLPDYDIWIEHFGVDKNGEPPKFYSEAERANYKHGMAWKRETHKLNKTKLVETYSWWHFDGLLTNNLWTELKKLGVHIQRVDPKPVWERLMNSRKSALVREFAKLVAAFISLAKSNRIDADHLDAVIDKAEVAGIARSRVRAFVTQVRPLYLRYEKKLEESNAIDFHDMINSATDRITEDSSCVPKYKYVIVDEFQDISTSRKDLIKSVLAATGAKLFCVGDDWQSIYRFAGSDISIFTRFKEHFGFTKMIRLENTYRNSHELLTVAGKFIMKNRQQLRKNLKSTTHCRNPVVCIPYRIKAEIIEALHTALEKIAVEAQGSEKTVLLLGRHNLEFEWPLNAKDITASDNHELLIWKPHPELKISFMTVHKSKGLEADYVILLNFQNDILGFPNQIADDPILAMLLSAKEDVMFAEERRVFYVAMTRTKNRLYILTPNEDPSSFLEDLPDEARCQATIDHDTAPCPKCKKGHLTLRTPKFGDKTPFYGCSNYPRCDYTLHQQRIPINAQTPRCRCGGFIVPIRNRKNGQDFLGCTEFQRIQPFHHDQRPMPDNRGTGVSGPGPLWYRDRAEGDIGEASLGDTVTICNYPRIGRAAGRSVEGTCDEPYEALISVAPVAQWRGARAKRRSAAICRASEFERCPAALAPSLELKQILVIRCLANLPEVFSCRVLYHNFRRQYHSDHITRVWRPSTPRDPEELLPARIACLRCYRQNMLQYSSCSGQKTVAFVKSKIKKGNRHEEARCFRRVGNGSGRRPGVGSVELVAGERKRLCRCFARYRLALQGRERLRTFALLQLFAGRRRRAVDVPRLERFRGDLPVAAGVRQSRQGSVRAVRLRQLQRFVGL